MDLYRLTHSALLALCFAFAVNGTAYAQISPQEKGLAIAVKVDARDEGFGDTSSVLTMVLRNAHGEEVTRQMRSRALEVADDGDKSMIIFEDPADVKGTALLTFSHKTADDDQWLYLPALKRVKRISSSNKSGPFMGSEFAYEDLSSQEVEKYTYKFVRDESIDGVDYFVMERYPVDRKSGYTRQIVWIDQDEYRVHKIDYFDRKASHLKTLTMHNYKLYLDAFWRPLRMQMVNHQTGKSTVLSWTEYSFQNGFTDSDFDRNSLQKAR